MYDTAMIERPSSNDGPDGLREARWSRCWGLANAAGDPGSPNRGRRRERFFDLEDAVGVARLESPQRTLGAMRETS
jgi:hypothetical protein